MKRVALVFGVIALLLLGDGLYMQVTNYQPGDQNPIFGNPKYIVSDGTTVLVAGGLMLAVSLVMWLAGRRRAGRQPGSADDQRARSDRQSASKT